MMASTARAINSNRVCVVDQPDEAARVAVWAVGDKDGSDEPPDPVGVHAPVVGSHVWEDAPVPVPVPLPAVDEVPVPILAAEPDPVPVGEVPDVPLLGVAIRIAPPVPVVHWTGPCLSQAGG